MKYFDKLKSRTELQAILVALLVMFLNRKFGLGLTPDDIYAMFGGAGSYALGRGIAKSNASSAPDKSGSLSEAEPSPDELGT